jgi:hypothetical protein
MAGQRGGKRGQGHGEDDAWEEGKQEVDGGGLHSGGRRGSCTGGRAGEQRSRGQRGFRGRREGGGPEDRFVKTKNFRDPIVKKDFPLISRFSEKKPKVKVVEFFKLYKIALGLKFKNSKFAALHDRF